MQCFCRVEFRVSRKQSIGKNQKYVNHRLFHDDATRTTTFYSKIVLLAMYIVYTCILLGIHVYVLMT